MAFGGWRRRRAAASVCLERAGLALVAAGGVVAAAAVVVVAVERVAAPLTAAMADQADDVCPEEVAGAAVVFGSACHFRKTRREDRHEI